VADVLFVGHEVGCLSYFHECASEPFIIVVTVSFKKQDNSQAFDFDIPWCFFQHHIQSVSPSIWRVAHSSQYHCHLHIKLSNLVIMGSHHIMSVVNPGVRQCSFLVGMSPAVDVSFQCRKFNLRNSCWVLEMFEYFPGICIRISWGFKCSVQDCFKCVTSNAKFSKDVPDW